MKKVLWRVFLCILTSSTASCTAGATSGSQIAIREHLAIICPDNSVQIVLRGDSEWNELKSLLEAVHPEKGETAFKQAVSRACKQ